jgi:hypothetical protein
LLYVFPVVHAIVGICAGDARRPAGPAKISSPTIRALELSS